MGGARGEADIHDWHMQFFPLWMTGYSNWLVYIHLASEGWLKEQSDILLVWLIPFLLPYSELDEKTNKLIRTDMLILQFWKDFFCVGGPTDLVLDISFTAPS